MDDLPRGRDRPGGLRPHAGGPADLSHAGRALNLDTWRGQQVTLARLEPGRELADALLLAEPAESRSIADAPISREEIRRLDAELPAVVDAWVPAHAPSRLAAAWLTMAR